jgi:hypothetical protein
MSHLSNELISVGSESDETVLSHQLSGTENSWKVVDTASKTPKTSASYSKKVRTSTATTDIVGNDLTSFCFFG